MTHASQTAPPDIVAARAPAQPAVAGRMTCAPRRSGPVPGTTLLELATALAILGVLVGATLPALRRSLDEYAVRSARTSLAAGIARARSAGIAHGGARFVVDPPAARFWVEGEAGDTLGRVVDLAADYRVALRTGVAEQARVELRFDGFGIGRVASRTFTLARGAATARVTVSSYGRVNP